MQFRWLIPEDMGARILRLLDLGNVIENDLIKKLRNIPGAQIFNLDTNGKQFETQALGGHVKGHIDGVGQNFPGIDTKDQFLLEFKTANDNRFNNLLKLGSYCEWSEEYAAQLHLYMGLFNFKHAIAIVYNKNNSDLYTEIIKYDNDAFNSLMEKAENILLAEIPPDNYIPETDYRIKSYMTPGQQARYLGKALPPKTHCRSCRFAKVDIDKGDAHWHCIQHDRKINEDRQIKSCSRHNFIPELIPAHVIEKDDDMVLYEKDKIRFVNVAENLNTPGENFFSSKELIEVVNSGFPEDILKTCDNVKKLFNGSSIAEIRPWVENRPPF
jgi:hypothetical protein